MPYKFVNSSLGTGAHTINMEPTTGFYYENGNGDNSEYTASSTALGISYQTNYANPYVSRYYAVKGSNNAITGLSFTYTLSIGRRTGSIYRIGFRNKFGGTIHFKIVSYSGGAGGSGATSTIIDTDAEAEVEGGDEAYMGSGQIPVHSLSLGGYASTRYTITITATSTQGEVISLYLPLVYLSDTTQYGISGGVGTVEAPVTGTGYSSTNILTSKIQSNFVVPDEHYATPTTLNLVDKTFIYADYE